MFYQAEVKNLKIICTHLIITRLMDQTGHYHTLYFYSKQKLCWTIMTDHMITPQPQPPLHNSHMCGLISLKCLWSPFNGLFYYVFQGVTVIINTCQTYSLEQPTPFFFSLKNIKEIKFNHSCQIDKKSFLF